MVPTKESLASRLRDMSRRIVGGRRILLLTWYGWVNVNLADYLQRKSRRDAVIKICRDDVLEAGMCSVSREATDLSISEDYQNTSFSGLDLWEICKSSICDEALQTHLDPCRDADTIRHFFSEAVKLICGFERVYKELQPTTIVVEQGLQYDMRVAVEVARRHGIQTVAIENSFLQDYFFMDDCSGAITNRHALARNCWDRIRARVLSNEQRLQTREFLEDASTTFTQRQPIAQDELRRELKVDPGKKIVLLIGQVATDAAIVMDSPLYEDQVDFMLDAVNAMAAHQETHHLVIRLHPKEATGNSHNGKPFANRTLKRLKELGIDRQSHVTIVHSDHMNTYQIMDQADFGMTITSQAGLEMLARHKPMLVAGDAFYARKGFTWEVTHRCQLAPTLACATKSSLLNERQKADVDNFLYTLCFEYLFPKNLKGCDDRIRGIFR